MTRTAPGQLAHRSRHQKQTEHLVPLDHELPVDAERMRGEEIHHYAEPRFLSRQERGAPILEAVEQRPGGHHFEATLRNFEQAEVLGDDLSLLSNLDPPARGAGWKGRERPADLRAAASPHRAPAPMKCRKVHSADPDCAPVARCCRRRRTRCTCSAVLMSRKKRVKARAVTATVSREGAGPVEQRVRPRRADSAEAAGATGLAHLLHDAERLLALESPDHPAEGAGEPAHVASQPGVLGRAVGGGRRGICIGETENPGDHRVLSCNLLDLLPTI